MHNNKQDLELKKRERQKNFKIQRNCQKKKKSHNTEALKTKKSSPRLLATKNPAHS